MILNTEHIKGTVHIETMITTRGNVAIICKVNNDKDFEKKASIICGQSYRNWKAFFICNEVTLKSGIALNAKDDRICILEDGAKPDIKTVIEESGADFFIAIDQDDSVSFDYIRMLVYKATETKCTVAAGDIAYFNEKTKKYEYSNLSPFRSITGIDSKEHIQDLYERYGKFTADIGSAYGKLIKVDCFKKLDAGHCIDTVEEIYESIITGIESISIVHGAYYFKQKMSSEECDSYLNSIRTPISEHFTEYETLKKDIMSTKYKFISFDVFDTLILRNVYEPKDLFRFLDKEYNELFETCSYTRFSEMRVCAEIECRERVFKSHPEYEDVTLDEIYETIQQLYQLDSKKLNSLKEKEIVLEERFCIPRECGKDLYELAKYADKKVVCTSDMYLSDSVISKILADNGMDQIDKIYVSSSTRAGKYSGAAFKRLPKWLGCSADGILHIGDNKIVDVEKASECGIHSFYLPNVCDLFWGRAGEEYKGESAGYIFGLNGGSGNYYFPTYGNLGVKCMLSQVINKFYDNPFTGFNKDSDFDADPYYIGYFALGMHLWSFTDWITSESKAYNKVHFLSRDGYLMKQIYDVMNSHRESPKSEYTLMSRNIITLCDMTKDEDLWALREKLAVYTASPNKILKMFKPGFSENSEKEYFEKIKSLKLDASKPIKDEKTYSKVIQVLQECIEWDLMSKYRSKLKQYFSGIFHNNECIVDAGYNGRVEASIGALCGIKLDSFYYHCEKDLLYDRSNRYSFMNRCFYREHPIISYLVREQFISKIAPSIKGIEFEGDEAKLVFGEFEMDQFSELITQTIQDAALDFAKDIMAVFGDVQELIRYRWGDASRPFDYLCNNGKETDISIFSCTIFEDDFGWEKRFNLAEHWKELQSINNVQRADNRHVDDYIIFKKYYLKAEKFLPKNSKRRAFVRGLVKFILRKK